MSLTSELSDTRSALTRWCGETFAGTAAVVEEVQARTAELQPIRPQARALQPRHWAQVGGMWGQRLAELVQPAPPYYALLGMIRAGWVTPDWAHRQAAAYPTHRRLPARLWPCALDMRPIVGGWIDLGLMRGGNGVPAAGTADAWADVLTHHQVQLEAHAPTGTLGSVEVEAHRARVAWLLSACEDVYRSGVVDERLAGQLGDGRRPALRELGALADEDQVTEVVKLGMRLRSSGTLEQLRALAGDPATGQALGIAAPTIVPQWADGDLLLGGGANHDAGPEGTTLLDVKTVLSLRHAERVARWLWQILLYAWLDSADLYRIRRVGLLLARHGVLVSWPLEELVERLLGRADPRQQARAQFRALAARVIASAGGAFPVV